MNCERTLGTERALFLPREQLDALVVCGEEWCGARACRRHCCGSGRTLNSDDAATRRQLDSNLQHVLAAPVQGARARR